MLRGLQINNDLALKSRGVVACPSQRTILKLDANSSDHRIRSVPATFLGNQASLWWSFVGEAVQTLYGERKGIPFTPRSHTATNRAEPV